MKNNHPSVKLADYKINVRIKLALLWTSLMFLYIYADFFDMKAPGVIEQMINLETPIGSLTPQLLVIFSIILIIPSLMIFLSVFLSPAISKWLNVIVSALWSVMSFILLVDLIGSTWYMFYVLFQVVEIIVFTMIIWTALKWPKTEKSV